jgi:hypothetical protein
MWEDFTCLTTGLDIDMGASFLTPQTDQFI